MKQGFLEGGWVFAFVVYSILYCLMYRKHLATIAANWAQENVPFTHDEIEDAPRGSLMLVAVLLGFAAFTYNQNVIISCTVIGGLCLFFWIGHALMTAINGPQASVKSWHYWNVARMAAGHSVYVMLIVVVFAATVTNEPIRQDYSDVQTVDDWHALSDAEQITLSFQWASVLLTNEGQSLDAIGTVAENLRACIEGYNSGNLAIHELVGACYMLTK